MVNMLGDDERTVVIAALADGNSIRAVERMTGIYRNTVMRLGVKVGEECQRILNNKMRNLNCKRLELDEIWGYVAKKEAHVTKRDPKTLVGDMWTFVAIDAKTKLVPCFRVGKRDARTANAFLIDLASRLNSRVQLSTDGLKAYIDAVERGFGGECDYGQIVKSYAIKEGDETAGMAQRKYSPPEVVRITKAVISGSPDMDLVSTSYVERQNLTMRMSIRRLTRLTNAFSKKLRNFKAAIALHYAVYNLVRVHGTLKATPAMAAGITERPWTIRELVELTT